MAPKARTVTPTLTISLLGPPRIERDGEAVAVDTRKAIALVAYIALARRPVGREEVAALLWPDSDHVRARAALRRTLSSLQTALDGHGLVIEGDTLALDEHAVTVDVERFQRLAQESSPDALREAVTTYRGDLLAGFALRDSAEFDDWQVGAGESLRRDLALVLERLTDALSPSDAALEFAHRWIELDPLHEPAHRALMRLSATRGDRASALRQYRECVAVLERELGVEPLEETTALYEALRENRTPDDAAPPPPRAPVGPAPALPLVGREDELAAMRDAYASIGSDGHLVVIGGEPGIGKTRLATEFTSALLDRGAVVLTARCHPDEDRLAFGAVVELLRAARDAPGLRTSPAAALAEAARLLPDLAPGAQAPVSLDSPAARRRLFDAVADVLAAACGGEKAGVIFVDDVHWGDESSLDAIRFLVRRMEGRRICVLLTWRTEEVPPAHPLRRTLGEASRAGRATGITLGRLSASNVGELVRAAGADADALTSTLWEESAGVPFFLTEYLTAVLHDPAGAQLPAGVRDLLASRVGDVSRTAAQVMTAAAVIGRPFDPEIVRDTSGRSREEVAGALEELTEHGLVAYVDGAYDFTHPKLREYVYGAATHARRRLLHGRAAVTFLRDSRRHPDSAALAAHHLERAGRDAEAGPLYRVAGDHARSLFANAEALAHYRSALALSDEGASALHEAIGDLLTLQGAYRDALANYETAAALGAGADVERKLGSVHHRLGDWDAADAHYAEALDGTASPGERARVLADRSLNAHRAGRRSDARALAREAFRAATEDGDARALAKAHNIAGIVASSVGDAAEARDHLEASLGFAEQLGDAAAIAAALNNLALALRQDEIDRALELEQRALELTARIGDRHREAALHSNLADLLHAAGRSEEAAEHIRSSAAIFADVGTPDELHPEIWKLVEW